MDTKTKKTIRVTTRSRFGYAASNHPMQTPTGLTIPAPPAARTHDLGWKQLRAWRGCEARYNSGKFWNEAVFHRGVRIAAGHDAVSDLLRALEIEGAADVVAE